MEVNHILETIRMVEEEHLDIRRILKKICRGIRGILH